MTTTGKLPPYRLDPESGRIVLRPAAPTWSFTESTGVLMNENAFGYHSTDDTGAVLNGNNQPTLKANGAFVWFTYQSTKSPGDQQVTFRGRRLEDDGTREASPHEQTIDISGVEAGHVFVSDSRYFDNVGLLVSESGGFDGTIDYGVVMPETFGGTLTHLWGASLFFRPLSALSLYRAGYTVSSFVPGAGGGLTSLVSREFRYNDPFQRAAHDRPGFDHHLDLDTSFSGEPNEGLVMTVGVRSAYVEFTTIVT